MQKKRLVFHMKRLTSILHCMVDENWTLDKFLGDVTGIPKKDVEKIYQMYQNTQHKRILPERVRSIYGDF